jgi:hypothetical protein
VTYRRRFCVRLHYPLYPRIRLLLPQEAITYLYTLVLHQILLHHILFNHFMEHSTLRISDISHLYKTMHIVFCHKILNYKHKKKKGRMSTSLLGLLSVGCGYARCSPTLNCVMSHTLTWKCHMAQPGAARAPMTRTEALCICFNYGARHEQ